MICRFSYTKNKLHIYKGNDHWKQTLDLRVKSHDKGCNSVLKNAGKTVKCPSMIFYISYILWTFHWRSQVYFRLHFDLVSWSSWLLFSLASFCRRYVSRPDGPSFLPWWTLFPPLIDPLPSPYGPSSLPWSPPVDCSPLPKRPPEGGKPPPYHAVKEVYRFPALRSSSCR